MSVLTEDNVAIRVRGIYQDLLDEQALDSVSGTVFSHLGSFTLDYVSSIVDWMEESMVSSGDKRIVIKRMLTILIEGLKNVRKHGEFDPQGEQLGFLIIAKSEERYNISIANLVGSERSDDLVQFIGEVNAFPDEELPIKLARALDAEFVDSKSGAGLGMIVTRIKTGEKLHFHSFKLNPALDLFVFEVSLSRTRQ